MYFSSSIVKTMKLKWLMNFKIYQQKHSRGVSRQRKIRRGRGRRNQFVISIRGIFWNRSNNIAMFHLVCTVLQFCFEKKKNFTIIYLRDVQFCDKTKKKKKLFRAVWWITPTLSCLSLWLARGSFQRSLTPSLSRRSVIIIIFFLFSILFARNAWLRMCIYWRYASNIDIEILATHFEYIFFHVFFILI